MWAGYAGAMPDRNIAVLIVDDQPLMSGALKLLVENAPNMHCVGIAANGVEYFDEPALAPAVLKVSWTPASNVPETVGAPPRRVMTRTTAPIAFDPHGRSFASIARNVSSSMSSG